MENGNSITISYQLSLFGINWCGSGFHFRVLSRNFLPTTCIREDPATMHFICFYWLVGVDICVDIHAGYYYEYDCLTIDPCSLSSVCRHEFKLEDPCSWCDVSGVLWYYALCGSFWLTILSSSILLFEGCNVVGTTAGEWSCQVGDLSDQVISWMYQVGVLFH